MIPIEEVLDGIRGEITRQERDPKHYKLPDIALVDDGRDKWGDIANEYEWGNANSVVVRTRAAEAAVLAIRLILRGRRADDRC